MATKNYLSERQANRMARVISNVGGTAFANGDQSGAIDLGAGATPISWQVSGTFGAGGSIQLEAANDTSQGWVVVGSALTAAGLVVATIPVRYIRVNVTAGDGTTALVVTLNIVPQRGA